MLTTDAIAAGSTVRLIIKTKQKNTLFGLRVSSQGVFRGRNIWGVTVIGTIDLRVRNKNTKFKIVHGELISMYLVRPAYFIDFQKAETRQYDPK